MSGLLFFMHKLNLQGMTCSFFCTFYLEQDLFIHFFITEGPDLYEYSNNIFIPLSFDKN